MIVVDSCGWLEAFAGTRLGDEYVDALSDLSRVVVPTVCLYEVFRRISAQHGQRTAVEYFAAMRRAAVAAFDATLAPAAARLGLEHGLPFADSVIYATAQSRSAEVWTHDPHFRGLPAVRLVELPGA